MDTPEIRAARSYVSSALEALHPLRGKERVEVEDVLYKLQKSLEILEALQRGETREIRAKKWYEENGEAIEAERQRHR